MSQVASLVSTTDEARRKKIIEQLRNLLFSLEEPADVVQQIAFRYLEIAMVRVGVDLKCFDLLAAKKEGVSLDELIEETKAARVLLGTYF
jgi:demethylsterigmatocystin 6-O-methyltransferase